MEKHYSLEGAQCSSNIIYGCFGLKQYFICCRLLTFFKINVFKKFYQEHYSSIKQLGSRSGPMFHVGPDLGPNCLQRISAEDKSPLHLARKEL